MVRQNLKIHRPPRRGGFTLVESAIATVIIGVAVTAMLLLLTTGTVVNKKSTELTTAINLAGNIHEAAVRVGYDDLFDLEGSHNPPVNARLQSLAAMSGWSQVVDVNYVDADRLTTLVPDTQLEPTTRIGVTINRNGRFIYRTSWVATASD